MTARSYQQRPEGGEERPEGYYHQRPEPVEAAPYCDRCGRYHGGAIGWCPEDDYDDDEDDEPSSPAFMDDDGEPRCTNPGGHEWPFGIEERERCLCIHCGADGDA